MVKFSKVFISQKFALKIYFDVVKEELRGFERGRFLNPLFKNKTSFGLLFTTELSTCNFSFTFIKNINFAIYKMSIFWR